MVRIITRTIMTITVIQAGSPGWKLGEELTTPHCKNQSVNEILHRASDLDGYLAQDRDQWQTLVNMIMNLWVP
jgi:hypothetical protein